MINFYKKFWDWFDQAAQAKTDAIFAPYWAEIEEMEAEIEVNENDEL